MGRKVSLLFPPSCSEGNFCSREEVAELVSESDLISCSKQDLQVVFVHLCSIVPTSLALGKTRNGKAFMLLP